MVPEEKLDGRYVLKEELGRGAMGVVWRAWDPKLERSVAIKVLRGSGSGRSTVATPPLRKHASRVSSGARGSP